MQRTPFRPTPAVRHYMRVIKIGWMGSTKPPQDAVALLAGLVVLASDPQTAYWATKSLFDGDHAKAAQWKEAITRVSPLTTIAVDRIVACTKAYGQHFPNQRLSRQNMNLGQVLQVMTQVQNADAYVGHCKAAGFKYAGAIFHPNTHSYTAAELKGLEGDLAHQGVGLGKEIKTIDGS